MISHAGEVPKRLKGLVSKTDSGRKSSEGSNPSFSAINENKARTKMRVFFVFGIIEALPKNRLIRFRPNCRNKRQVIRSALTDLQFYNQAPLPSYEACRLVLC